MTNIPVLLLILIAPVLLGLGLLILGWNIRRDGRGAGAVLMALGALVLLPYIVAVAAYVRWVAPNQSGIVEQGFSPSGREYCVVQTYNDLIEPYRVSFYLRDAEGTWRWHYLEHEDFFWRSATVEFVDGAVSVSRNGAPFRTINLPPPSSRSPSELGQRDLPAGFSADAVFENHQSSFD